MNKQTIISDGTKNKDVSILVYDADVSIKASNWLITDLFICVIVTKS